MFLFTERNLIMSHLQNAFSPIFNAGFRSFFLALVILSLASVESRAQSQELFSALPQGEDFISGGQVVNEVGSSSVFCTNRAIYHGRGKVWAPPFDAGAIYKMTIKSSTPSQHSGLGWSVLVLTTTGQLFVVGATPATGEIFSYEVASPSSQSQWNQICGDALYLHSTSGLVYVTHDDSTWQIDTAGFGTAQSQYLALDTAQNVYAASGSGIFKQGPSDFSWNLLPSSTSIESFYLFVSHADVIYAPTNNGILMSSSDHGATWAFDSTGMGVQLVNFISDDSVGNLYATSSYGSDANFVWMKPVGGVWRSIGAGIGHLAYDSVSQLYESYLTGVVADSGIHVATSFGLFSSYDTGATWQPDNNGIAAEEIYGFYEFPDGKRITTTNLALFTEQAGDTTWNESFPQNSYLPGVRFFVDNAKRLYVLGTSRQEDTSKSGIQNYLQFPDDIFISTDEGSTWASDTTGLSQFASQQGNRSTEFIDETGTEHIATYETPHMRLFSKSPGGSWRGDSDGYTPQNGDEASVFATDRHGSIYLAINNGTSAYKLLSRPIASGTAWSEVSTTALGGTPYVFTATKDGKLIGGGANVKTGYYDGSTWTVMNSPPGKSSYYSFALSVDSSNQLWSAYGINQYYAPDVFSTTDLGLTWTLASDTSPTFASMVSFGDTTYGLLSGNGLYYFVPGSAGVTPDIATNNAFSITPNPSTGKGEISFTVSERNNVQVTIFNVLGQEIATPVQGVFDAGTHTGSFDLSSLPPGTYYCRIQSEGIVETQTIVIER